MSSSRTRRIAAFAGLMSPLLFAGVLLILTILQYRFLRSLGWDPLLRPTFDWPSGLALGPLGWIMTVTFLLSGGLLSVFAWGLRAELQNSSGQSGTILLAWAGVAMMGLAFTTDRTISVVPVTWHGRLHDLSFMALGLMLIPALILFGISFRKIEGWSRLSVFAWVTSALAVPTFAVKGIVFYAFLLSMLLWNELAAVHLWRGKSR